MKTVKATRPRTAAKPPTATGNLADLMKAHPKVCVSTINYYSAGATYSVSLQDRDSGRYFFGKSDTLDAAIQAAVDEFNSHKS